MTDVSVIIPIRKSDKNVGDCVQAVRNSDYYGTIEIVVVDEGLERSKQRNIGIDRATGEYLLFLDSDQIISKGLIQECAERIDSCVAIYIPEIITTKGFFGRLRNWERQFYTGTVVDVVKFIRKKDCPRYDETMSGPEDSDWDRHVLGRKIIAHKPLFHKDDIGFIDYLKKKAYYSKSMARYKEKHPKDKVLNFWYRCFLIYFEDGKWKRCVRRPDLFICLMGLVFLRGIIYTWQRIS